MNRSIAQSNGLTRRRLLRAAAAQNALGVAGLVASRLGLASTALASPRRARQPELRTDYVFAVGDSVMLGAKPTLQQLVPATEVDAVVSRQILSVTAILRSRAASGMLGDFVVIHTGNNGPVTEGEFDTMMTSVSGAAHVILLNNKERRSWEEANDVLFAWKAPQYDNVDLIDWRSASAAHPEYFGEDGIHLRGAGAWAYAQLIAEKLAPYGVSVAGD